MKRSNLLCTFESLLNLRTRVIGLNKIRTVYANEGTDTPASVIRLAAELDQDAMGYDSE